jgi:predicted amidophosphoribosyltransferase
LVDDIMDSRWTLAVCANLLGECGCESVIPFCLADSSDGGLND